LTILGLSSATLLLVLASTGGAVAGALVTGKQIKDSTITSADIKNKSITKSDLASSAVPPAGAKGAPGAPGVAGAPGPAGQPGPAGVAGANGFTRVTTRSKAIAPSNGGATVDVFCEADERAVTAAFQSSTTNGGKPVITNSYPITSGREPVIGAIPLASGWTATLANFSDVANSTVLGSVAVVCATP
jgi:hypothetical protein